MRLYFLRLTILVLAAFGPLESYASGYFYYQEQAADPSDQNIQASYDNIKYLSKKANFLDCPIELIERQWRGSESVLRGADLMQRMLAESHSPNPNYKPLMKECMDTLESYRQMDRDGKIRARAIVGNEKAELFNQLSSTSQEGQRLMEIIADSINQETLCQTNRLVFQAGYILGLSSGAYKMNCVTPLGRRFKLRGPVLGVSFGVGASLSLPNIESRNPVTFSIALYKRSESRLWRMTNLVSTATTGFGLSAEHDMVRCYRGYNDSAKYIYDIKPAVGAGIFIEKTANLMGRSHQSPLYIKLVKANMLNHMQKKQISLN